MALKKILVAYDGSECGKKALAQAGDIAGLDQSIEVDVVNVVAVPLLSDDQMTSFASILDMMEKDAWELLDAAVAILDENGAVDNTVQELLVKGTDPAREIAKLVDKEDYDLIIVGSRGLSGWKEFMGSVSHKLLGEVAVPVLVVK